MEIRQSALGSSAEYRAPNCKKWRCQIVISFLLLVNELLLFIVVKIIIVIIIIITDGALSVLGRQRILAIIIA